MKNLIWQNHSKLVIAHNQIVEFVDDCNKKKRDREKKITKYIYVH